MKPVFISLFILITSNLSAQTYQYYFIEVRATGKLEVAIKPEFEVQYPGIDTLVCVRTTDSRGKETIKEKKYPGYSDAFNALSSAGLEFVQFANLPTAGGGLTVIAGELRANYMVWRKRIM